MAAFESIPNQLITHEDFLLLKGPIGYVKVPALQDATRTRKIVLPQTFMDVYDEIKSLEALDDDVWIVSHPKCGTTWAQEMVWLLDHDLDYEEGAKRDIKLRSPYLEGSPMHKHVPGGNASVVQCKEQPRPRHFKSHLFADLLPDQVWSRNSKVIVVLRNPKDAAISFYHYCVNYLGFKGTQGQFMEAFLSDQVILGGFFEHFFSYWELRDRPNVLIISYEDMKTDLLAEIKKVSAFLGKSYTEEAYQKLASHLSLENMRKNPTVNWENRMNYVADSMSKERNRGFQFIRKGVVGSHKEEMSPELSERFDDWIEKSLRGCDFRFKFSI